MALSWVLGGQGVAQPPFLPPLGGSRGALESRPGPIPPGDQITMVGAVAVLAEATRGAPAAEAAVPTHDLGLGRGSAANHAGITTGTLCVLPP